MRHGETPCGGEYHESYDKLALCPGAVPLRPPLPGIDHPRVHVLRNVEDMDAIKRVVDEGARRAVIIGGGYIGVEMAENLRHRGLSVDLVEMFDQIMPPLDREMVTAVEEHMRQHGVRLHLGTAAAAFRDSAAGVLTELRSGATIESDLVLLSAGVKSETTLARAAGLDIGPRGGIRVDAHMRTSDPDIYAAGDAVEVPHTVMPDTWLIPLAGQANRQARIAADAIFGRSSEYSSTQGTAIVKIFGMVAAVTGATEKNLSRANLPYRKVYLHPSGHAGYYPGTAPMHLKLLFAPETGKLLGAQAVGFDGVDKRVDVLATAVRAGMSVFDLQDLELAYAPPFGSAKDPVNMAGFVAANLLRGDVVFWHAEDFPAKTENGLLLDVRNKPEFDLWHIRGAVNIPLGELRRRIGELPRDKPLFLYAGASLLCLDRLLCGRTPPAGRPPPARTAMPQATDQAIPEPGSDAANAVRVFSVPIDPNRIRHAIGIEFRLRSRSGPVPCTVQVSAVPDHHRGFSHDYLSQAVGIEGFRFHAPLRDAAAYWKPEGHDAGWSVWEIAALRSIRVKVFPERSVPRDALDLKFAFTPGNPSPAAPRLAWAQPLSDPVPLGRRFELAFDIDGVHGNPFDPDQVSLLLSVTTPAGRPVETRGFLYQNFAPVDSDGRFFYPVGWCILCPIDRPHREDYVPYLPPENSMGMMKKMLDDLAGSGGNCARFWMTEWWSEVEWARHVDNYGGMGRYNLKHAWRVDQVLEHCERRGLSLVFATMNHLRTWQPQERYGGAWADHPYSSANGGFLDRRLAYWTDPRVVEPERKRLAYIVARFADSPAVHSWEYISESDLASRGVDWDAVEKRISECLAFIRAHDPYGHPLSTHTSDPTLARRLSSNPIFDYEQSNAYAGCFSDDQVYSVRYFSEVFADNPAPVLITEYAGRWCTEPPDRMLRDSIGGLWAGVCSRLSGAPMSWWWNFNYGEDIGRLWKVAADFMKDEDLAAEDAGTRGPWKNHPVRIRSADGSARGMMVGNRRRRFLYLFNAWSWRIHPLLSAVRPDIAARCVFEARIALPEGCRDSAPEIRDAQGGPVRAWWTFLGSRDGWRIQIEAAARPPFDVAPKPSNDAATGLRDENEIGLLLTVTPHHGRACEAAEEIEQAFAAAGRGRSLRVARVDDVENPVGENDHYLARYHGPLLIPRDGEYRFASNSDDGSLVKIDGRPVVAWLGQHDMEQQNGPMVNRWEHQRAIRLDKGVHTLDYYHQEGGGAQLARLGWQVPATAPATPEHAYFAHPLDGPPTGWDMVRDPFLDGRVPCLVEVMHRGRRVCETTPCRGLRLRRPRKDLPWIAVRPDPDANWNYRCLAAPGRILWTVNGIRVPIWADDTHWRPFSLEWERTPSAGNAPDLKTLSFDLAAPLSVTVGQRSCGTQAHRPRHWAFWPLRDEETNQTFRIDLDGIPLLEATTGDWIVAGPPRIDPTPINSATRPTSSPTRRRT